MNATTCRSGRHPVSERYTAPNGHSFCGPCHREVKGYRTLTRPVGRNAWADPIHDAETAARLAAWQATVDGAIARVRLAEGFDGTRHPWRTLGECLLPATAPAIVTLSAHRRAERLAS